MKCSTVELPQGGHAIVCGSQRYRVCTTHNRPAPFLCDWKTGKGKTCDGPMCPDCATEVAPNKHLCPAHSVAWKLHPAHGRV